MSARAIIIAAGRGRRLGPHTDEEPKCLVPVAGRSILAWQLDAFRVHGVTEVVIVRGYLGDVLEARARALAPDLDLRFADNPGWRDNNILLSLFCAADAIDGAVYVTYSDIIFTPAVVGALAAAGGELDLVIDRDFAAIYEGRTEHPLDEAEVADLDARGRVARVGKRALPPGEAWGEFIGLMRASPTGARWMREAWDELCARYRGRENEPFARAPAFRRAYLTDLLQHLIDAGRPVTPAGIRGQWREIDTEQDLHRARAVVESAEETWT